MRTNFIIKDIFKTKQCIKFVWLLETTSRWQKLKLFCTDLTNLYLKCNDFFPMNGTMHTNSFLGARAYIFFTYENIVQKSFHTNINKVKKDNHFF